MFEGINIVTSLSCVRGFVKKLDQYQTKQTDRYSYERDIIIFENSLFNENCALGRYQRLYSDN